MVKFLGDLTSLCNISHEIARHYQNSIFQTRLGFCHDGNEGHSPNCMQRNLYKSKKCHFNILSQFYCPHSLKHNASVKFDSINCTVQC